MLRAFLSALSLFFSLSKNLQASYLSAGSGDFVNDVSENDILVVGLRADFPPLGILSQTHVVPQERMSNAAF